METLTVLGHTIPRLGFGTWEIEGDDAYQPVRDALDIGYRHIDSAQMYGNEEAVGRAIADSGVDRDDIFLTTKVGPDKAAASDVRSSHDESLSRLGVDHVDLLLLHWPNLDVALAETLGAFTELRDAGKTSLIGVSNFPSDLLAQSIELAEIATDQVEYHPYLGQDVLLEPLREHGLMLTAYSPLAHGDVIGDERLTEIGAPYSKSAPQVALRWLIQQPGVVAIPRSTSRDHIASNFDIFDFELSDDDVKRIDDLEKDRRNTNPPWAPAWD